MRFFEKLPDAPPDDRDLDDCHLLFTDTVLVFDAVRHTFTIVSNASVTGDADVAYDEATARIERALQTLVNVELEAALMPVSEPEEPEPQSNFASREEFEATVQKCIDYIHAGDCVQVVPSQRFSVPLEAEPFAVYRALRHLSPGALYGVFGFRRQTVGRGFARNFGDRRRRRRFDSAFGGHASSRRKPTRKTTNSKPNCWPIPKNAPNTSCSLTSRATIWAASANTAASRSIS